MNASSEYVESEEIQKIVRQTLDEFICTKLNQETLFAMQAKLVQLFRHMYGCGMIMDEVNPSLVRLKSFENTVGPANVYTEALLNGCVRRGEGRDLEPVRRYSRYEIALA